LAASILHCVYTKSYRLSGLLIIVLMLMSNFVTILVVVIIALMLMPEFSTILVAVYFGVKRDHFVGLNGG
jgi:hypothetical protein